ncbi:MAG: dTMP kinase [Bdellovibrionales bacterium]
MPRGKFITLEGGEGAGKSTQARRLADALGKRGIKTILTREVGGAPGAEKIRTIWLEEGEGYWDKTSELMLVFAARREHLVRTVWPALKSGVWVISDRFMDSTRAYQGMEGGPTVRQIERLYKEIAGNFDPDLTILLDVPVATSMARVKKRGGWNDRYQLKPAGFHKKLRTIYLKLARKYKKRFAVVDAGEDIDVVTTEIETAVRRKFRI